MEETIEFWLMKYGNHMYVGRSIVVKRIGEAVEIIEPFNWVSKELYDNAVCELLRLNLRSDYEQREEIREILELILLEARWRFG